jgi:hypothetical protein
MYSRNDRTFYKNYIDEAEKEIFVMGVTAIRFFKDFADCEPSSPQDAKVLLGKLGQGVRVKILLPSIVFLKGFSKEDKKSDFDNVKQYVENIKKQLHTDLLEVRYFDHIPAHSIFIVDDTCIVGPVFPDIESRYTPALQLRNSSPIACKYLDYFNNEWENAHE